MRFLIASSIAILFSLPAAAQECIGDVVSLVGWSAKPEQGFTRVNIGLRNVGPADVRMIKGTVELLDPFGDPLIPQFELQPDVHLMSGNAGQIATYYFDDGARLTTVSPDLVTPRLCLTGVLFADGTML